MDNPARGPRISVNQAASLIDSKGDSIDCTIVDVSKEGFRLKVPRPIPPGNTYKLSFDRQSHPVDIRWASAGEAGGLFLPAASED